MTTFKHTDLESLIEDMRTAQYSDNPDEAMEILLAKKSKKELAKIYELCDTFAYVYDKLIAKGML